MSPILTAETVTLQHGERLSREEYEERYTQLPDVRAELLEGVVYLMSSPISADHGRPHALLMTSLGTYEAHTSGAMLYDSITIRLGISSDPEPDGVLLIPEEYGGRTRISDDRYVEGNPELVFEIARTSQDYDETIKLPIYARNGIPEYLLWKVEEGVIDWLTLRNGRYEKLLPGDDGITRSLIFPGLWLDLAALLQGDLKRLIHVITQGCASIEHGNFVQLLRSQKR
jgi:Uma2 family endonuclease